MVRELVKTQKAETAFLSAEWKKLLMANYTIDPELLGLFVPPGTELDFWNDKCYISLVGFMFLNTRVKGISIPWHRNFEEVNLRFYVKRKMQGEWRRGVVFIKEIVPKPAISLVANTRYKEHYVTRLMRHNWMEKAEYHECTYAWNPFPTLKWVEFTARHNAESVAIEPGSEAEFITEHYWGYTKWDKTCSLEYEVKHPKWEVYHVQDFRVTGSLLDEYGPIFSGVLSNSPSSVFLAKGSEVEVMNANMICVEP
ncbi:MAG: DUF2071 domain-containing protein [Saprospiraceae bacterium]|nr:DUF2071 domain-containing protein [Saprospiraceae bacterium]